MLSRLSGLRSFLQRPISVRILQSHHSNRLSTMATPTHYDSIIIGSGQGGTPLASALAGAGRKTALIDRAHLGGCCVNEGCTPTKTMIASGRVAYLARRAAEYGVHFGSGDGKDAAAAAAAAAVQIDMRQVRQRKRDIVDSFRGGSERRTAAAGVDVMMGQASFVDAKTLHVKLNDGSERRVSGESIFINTGERPGRPKLEGLEGIEPARVLDSTSIMELDEVPAHLVVLGGGYIGLEFGQLFRRLGAAVTIVQRGTQLLPREDKEFADCMAEILRKDGVVVHLNAAATRVSSSNTTIDVEIKASDSSSNSTTETISGSHILLAAGRVPNTDDLNLPAAGISTTGSRGHIAVNAQLETNVPGIYALGDVKGGPAFTHVSYDDFRILRDNLGLSSPTSSAATGSVRSTADRDLITPYVVYTDPQLGHVGLHETEARARYGDANVKVASMPMSYVARALETAETRGLMKAVVLVDNDGDGERKDGGKSKDEAQSETKGGEQTKTQAGRIVGFTCLGLEGGEIMAVVQTAMMGGLPWMALREAVWAHPSLAESLNNLWGFLK